MPRRNYGPGRRRPTANDGVALRRLSEQLAAPPKGPRPAPSGELTHRPDCPGAHVGTFVGRLGDLMARCSGCGVARVVDEPTTPKETNR